MITFTKEQLIASAHARIEFAEMMLAGELEPLTERTWSIELELARIALASLNAEPYGYLRENDGQIQMSIGPERPNNRSGGYATPWAAIYSSPPVVPDVLERLRSIVADHRALPRRKEWISGQQYSYVLLENVETMVDNACREAMIQDKGIQD